MKQHLRHFKIIVVQLVPDERLDHDDQMDQPEGVYDIHAENKEGALDTFHAQIPIAVLEHFDISVREIVTQSRIN